MTPDHRKAARERCDAATGGPWEDFFPEEDAPDDIGEDAHDFKAAVNTGDRPDGSNPCHHICLIGLFRAGLPQGTEKNNARFIAHAREDLPAALDEIDRLEKRVAELEEEIASRDAIEQEHEARAWRSPRQ